MCSKRRPSSPPSLTRMPQLHSQRMHAVGFQSAPRWVAVSAIIGSSRHEYLLDTEMVYFVYRGVNGPQGAAPVEASLPALLSRGSRARDHRREVVAIDRP